MPKLTLAERLERAAARKARAEQEAARLKSMQRKQRTRHLIEVGGLAVKAAIYELPPAALYERFLKIAEEAKKDPKAVSLWERAGTQSEKTWHRDDDDATRKGALCRPMATAPH